jgi:hypothetical protein
VIARAAVKLIHTSARVVTGTKFLRLPDAFGVKLFNGANADIVGHTVQPEIQDGGSKMEVPVFRAVIGTK